MRDSLVFRPPVIVLLAAIVSGCATVADRRADPPTFEGSTAKSLATLQDCFAAQFEKYPGVNYLPRGNGGTYSVAPGNGNYVIWTVDLADRGDSRLVTLHAAKSIWGNDKGLIAEVKSCL